MFPIFWVHIVGLWFRISWPEISTGNSICRSCETEELILSTVEIGDGHNVCVHGHHLETWNKVQVFVVPLIGRYAKCGRRFTRMCFYFCPIYLAINCLHCSDFVQDIQVWVIGVSGLINLHGNSGIHICIILPCCNGWYIYTHPPATKKFFQQVHHQW